jgi:hypothetical protein
LTIAAAAATTGSAISGSDHADPACDCSSPNAHPVGYNHYNHHVNITPAIAASNATPHTSTLGATPRCATFCPDAASFWVGTWPGESSWWDRNVITACTSGGRPVGIVCLRTKSHGVKLQVLVLQNEKLSSCLRADFECPLVMWKVLPHRNSCLHCRDTLTDELNYIVWQRKGYLILAI